MPHCRRGRLGSGPDRCIAPACAPSKLSTYLSNDLKVVVICRKELAPALHAMLRIGRFESCQ